MPFCTEKIVLIWKTRYKALAINTYRTEQKTKLEGKISGLCHNLMTYPSKNGRPSKNCRLSDLFGLAQSEGVQPIFLFTLSYTTNCPRNDISVKSYISIVKQNDEDTKEMFWIRENKGASITCRLQDWRWWLWILLILEIRNFYVVELDLKKPKNINFISHKGLGRIYSTREKQHKNSTLWTWYQMQMAACLAQSWVLGLLFPGIHKYVMEREKEIVQCTKCYKFRHQNS